MPALHEGALDRPRPVLVEARVAAAGGTPLSNYYTAPLIFKMVRKHNLDLGCVLISDPSTLCGGAKTRLHTPRAVTYHEQII